MSSTRIIVFFAVCWIGSVSALSIYGVSRQLADGRHPRGVKNVAFIDRHGKLYLPKKRSQPTDMLRNPEDLSMPAKRSEPENDLREAEDLVFVSPKKRFSRIANRRIFQLRLRPHPDRMHKRSQPEFDDMDSFFIPNPVRRLQPEESDEYFTLLKRSQPTDFGADGFSLFVSKRSQPEISTDDFSMLKRSQPEFRADDFGLLKRSQPEFHSDDFSLLKRSQPEFHADDFSLLKRSQPEFSTDDFSMYKRSQPELSTDDFTLLKRSQPEFHSDDFSMLKRSQPDFHPDDFTVLKRSQPEFNPDDFTLAKRSQPKITHEGFDPLINVKRAHSAVVRVIQARKRSQPTISESSFDGFSL